MSSLYLFVYFIHRFGMLKLKVTFEGVFSSWQLTLVYVLQNVLVSKIFNTGENL